ncbi:hypothetical protein [Fodinibius sp.]|uniref:hypothetical protein n=1 Tax=Fodinibius sp. TaxID=1872440 RepID=UPI002ACDF8E5|nr:hypothetical protein [Fodinibius sp.]MDZ7658052.1 hypothetical protein [Fodinibius sp.]
MRQIHESKIQVDKVKFELEYIETTFLLMAGKQEPEEFRQKAYASPHPDLIKQRQKIRRRFVEILDMPGKDEDMIDRFILKTIEFNHDNGQLKIEAKFKTPAFAKPVTMKCDWSNDFALKEYEQFLQEVKLFITKQKRAQSDMFGGDGYDDDSGSKPGYQAPEDRQLEGRSKGLPAHEEVDEDEAETAAA